MEPGWSELQAEALRRVHEGHRPARIGGARATLLARFVVSPSFGSPCCHALYSRQVGEHLEFVGTLLLWKRQVDAARFADPVERLRHLADFGPSMEEGEALLPEGDAQALAAAIEALRLDAVPQSPSWGVDGTDYDFYVGDAFGAMKLHWWQTVPANWCEAEELAMRLLDLVRAAVPSEAC